MFYDAAPKAQVPSEPGRGVIVAADLLPMAPIAGKRMLELDFLSLQHARLLTLPLTIIMKHFTHPLLTQYQKEVFEPNFHYVAHCKPDASRKESVEGYWLCKDWKG